MADVDRKTDLVERLTEACVGHHHAKISWPHCLLHDARDEIARLRDLEAELERVTAERDSHQQHNVTLGICIDRLSARAEAAEARLSKAETLLNDILRMCRAAQFVAGFGPRQFKRMEAARAFLTKTKEPSHAD